MNIANRVAEIEQESIKRLIDWESKAVWGDAFEDPPTSQEARTIVLDDAKAAVLSDRNADYGDPEDNFRDIAELWNSWLNVRFAYGEEPVILNRNDVAQMMIQVKQARMLTSPTVADHHTDIAGYAACGYASAIADSGDEVVLGTWDEVDE